MTSQKTGKNTRESGKSQTAQPKSATTAKITEAAKKPSKLDLLVDRLTRPDGATIAEMTAVTGWQADSVRGTLAGALKKKGHRITSEKVDGVRRYRIEVT